MPGILIFWCEQAEVSKLVPLDCQCGLIRVLNLKLAAHTITVVFPALLTTAVAVLQVTEWSSTDGPRK